MNFKEKFKRWRKGEEVEWGFEIDTSSPVFWLTLLVIALIVLWLIK